MKKIDCLKTRLEKKVKKSKLPVSRDMLIEFSKEIILEWIEENSIDVHTDRMIIDGKFSDEMVMAEDLRRFLIW